MIALVPKQLLTIQHVAVVSGTYNVVFAHAQKVDLVNTANVIILSQILKILKNVLWTEPVRFAQVRYSPSLL